MFRGEMEDAEDNWNVQLTNVTATGRDGRVSHMEHIFIRGSQIRFMVLPDMLKNAPMVRPRRGGAGHVRRRGRGMAPGLAHQPPARCRTEARVCVCRWGGGGGGGTWAPRARDDNDDDGVDAGRAVIAAHVCMHEPLTGPRSLRARSSSALIPRTK